MLGVDLEFPQNDRDLANRTLHKILQHMDNAHVIVLEYALCYQIAVRQVGYLLRNSKVEIVQQMDLDFQKNEEAIKFNQGMDKSYLKRRFLVLKPKNTSKDHIKMSPNLPLSFEL